MKMNRFQKSTKSLQTKQFGATLVSIMVGLLLGLFSVLAALSLYRVQARQASITQIAAHSLEAQDISLLMAESELHNAGFGIVGANIAQDFQFVRMATENPPPPGGPVSFFKPSVSIQRPLAQALNDQEINGVIWRWRNVSVSNVLLCGGLIAENGGLFYFNSECNTPGNALHLNDWPASARRVVIPESARLRIRFNARASACQIFEDSGGNSLELTITVRPDGTQENMPWSDETSLLLQTTKTLCLDGIRIPGGGGS